MASPVENRTVMDTGICNRRPVIRGTRITAQTVLEFLGAGDGIGEVLEAYPTLTRDDLLVCLRYSSRLMGHHFVIKQVA
jgi:uncharacterized protein (DUF433 family)